MAKRLRVTFSVTKAQYKELLEHAHHEGFKTVESYVKHIVADVYLP